MKYGADKQKVISGLKRISKPGLRVYAKSDEVPKVLGGLGIAIISTSNGVMSDKEARKLGVGGRSNLLCLVGRKYNVKNRKTACIASCRR